MYCVLSQKSVREFLSAKNKYSYIDNEVDYFSMKWEVHKKSLYDDLMIWVNWYAFFHNKPLFVSIMTNNFWTDGVKNDDIYHSIRLTKWGNMPDHAPSEEEKDKFMAPLPIKDRMWNDFEYFRNVCEIIAKNNFHLVPCVEVMLDGSLPVLHEIKTK